MLEAEVAEALADFGTRWDCPLAGATTEDTFSENAGFVIVTETGEKFLVTVTRIEEGQ